MDRLTLEKDFNNTKIENKRLASVEAFKDAPTSSYITCEICGFCGKDLAFHIIKIHHISCDEYKSRFNVAVVKCEDVCNKTRGSNNAAYQHGGKYSSFSDKFIHNDGSDNAKQKQKDVKERMYANGLGKVENKQNNVEFWTSRGYTLDEAKLKVSERQSTFSLSKCIEKYGEVEGRIKWKTRQDNWLLSYNNKTPTEMEEINRRKKSLSIHDLRRFLYKDTGILYIIKLENNHIKIGITTNSLLHRYKKDFSKITKVILEKNLGLQVAFMYEQIIKKQLYEYRIRKSECILDCGWTEVFKVTEDIIIDMYNDITLDNIIDMFMLQYPKSKKYFDEMSSIINEEKLNGTNNTCLDN